MAMQKLVKLAIGTMLAMGTLDAVAPALAQTYDPDYPVCLRLYGPATYNDCRYTSLAQCAVSASGRSAQCLVNPFYAYAQPAPVDPPYRRYRHRRG